MEKNKKKKEILFCYCTALARIKIKKEIILCLTFNFIVYYLGKYKYTYIIYLKFKKFYQSNYSSSSLELSSSLASVLDGRYLFDLLSSEERLQ